MNRHTDPHHLFVPRRNPRYAHACQKCGRVREHPIHTPPADWKATDQRWAA